MSAAEPPQGANCTPLGGSEAEKPRAWGDQTSASLLVLRGNDIHGLLDARTREIVAAVRDAYTEHANGRSFLPHSVFVRFPGREKERIIALPGYLGGDDEIAGIKWIASFPGNVQSGLSRASAVMVLNSMETGRP